MLDPESREIKPQYVYSVELHGQIIYIIATSPAQATKFLADMGIDAPVVSVMYQRVPMIRRAGILMPMGED